MVARAQHFVTIPTRVFTQNSDYNEQKQLIDAEIKERVEAFAAEFHDFLKRFNQ